MKYIGIHHSYYDRDNPEYGYWSATSDDYYENLFINYSCEHFIKLSNGAEPYFVDLLNHDEVTENEQPNLYFYNEVSKKKYKLKLYTPIQSPYVRKDVVADYPVVFVTYNELTHSSTGPYDPDVYTQFTSDSPASVVAIKNNNKNAEIYEDFDISDELLVNNVAYNSGKLYRYLSPNLGSFASYHHSRDGWYNNYELFYFERLQAPEFSLIFHLGETSVEGNSLNASITAELGWTWQVKQDWWWGPGNIWHHYYEWDRKTIINRSAPITSDIEVTDYLNTRNYKYYNFDVYYKIKYLLTPARKVIRTKIPGTRTNLFIEKK